MERPDVKLIAKPVDDGPSSNSIPMVSIQMSVVLPGIESPWVREVGKLRREYITIAQQFCDWWNAQQKGTP